mgnify:CR=1 FL=1
MIYDFFFREGAPGACVAGHGVRVRVVVAANHGETGPAAASPVASRIKLVPVVLVIVVLLLVVKQRGDGHLCCFIRWL